MILPKQKITICHIVYSFSKIGGLENGVINIINGLDQEVFNHIVVSLTDLGELKDRVFSRNVCYYAINKNEGNDFFLPSKLYSILVRHNVHVLHLRNWPTMVEGFLAGKLSKTPYIIYSEHGRHFESVWNNQKIKSFIIRYILKRVNRCLTVSENVAKEITQLYCLDREVDVILNGVDIDRFSNDTKHVDLGKFGLKEGCKIIGSVGRLVVGKRFDELIVDFSKSCFDGKLVIVGDGPERDNLERLARECGDGRVLLIGNHDDIANILNHFEFFVLPSESEGLSNAIMEAVSCGLPVIAYDVGGNSEIVHHQKGGVLVKWHDRNRFVDAVNELFYNDQLKSEMGRYNRDLAVNCFALDIMVSNYSRLYQRLSLSKLI